MLNIIKQDTFEDWLAEGLKIQEPASEEELEYNDKLLLRIPKITHRIIAVKGKRRNEH